MYRLILILLSSVLIGFSFNMLLLPHKVLSGGVTGVAMIVGLLTNFNTGTIIFMLNIPILIIGFLTLGRRFIILSIISVATISTSMHYIPLEPLANDPLLSSVFGGVLVGIGTGLIFRQGASTGGFDVIGMLITRRKELPLGSIIFMLNGVVVFISGFLFNWDLAMYTMASIFVTGKVIDAIHTRHIKLTLMIITSQGEELRRAMLNKLHRGITVMEGRGAFSEEGREVLITVISRYELPEVKEIIMLSDPKAFVNITETLEVVGVFRRT